MLTKRDVRGGTTSTARNQRGYILSSVVVLSIVIFASILIVLQYVSAVHGSVRSTIRLDSARQIANEQMRIALACAEAADSPSSCAKTNHSTGILNGNPSTTNIGFTPSANSMDIAATATVGNPAGLHDSFTVKARAPIKSTAIQTVELQETPADDSEWVTKLSAGSNHTCALTNEERLYCWGGNANGQLGDNTTLDRSSPQLISLANVKDVEAGMYHTCAIAGANHTVYCWGLNNYGQLGNGTLTAISAPQPLSPGITQATSISTANSHSCAVTSNKQLHCWGRNSDYQLGTGTATSYSTTRYTVTNSNINGQTEKVSAGHAHTCVVRTDSRVYCWGLSEQGAANVWGVNGHATTPRLQDNGRGYREIKAGHWHTCGIDTSSRVRCWGYNHNGQLGKSRPIMNIWGPDFTNTPPNSTSAIDSFAHTCAVSDGSVYCWGNPAQYRLGNSGSNVWSPYKVPGLNQATTVTTGDRHSCAAVNSGRQVVCWGDNTQGQYGFPDATKSPSSYPTPASLNLNPGSGSGSFQSDNVSAGAYSQHTCALQSGDAYCWGDNYYGQLGDGSNILSQVPIKVSIEDQSVLEIGTGLAHTCALLVDGAVKCWGSDGSGQIGNDTAAVNQLSPTPVSLGGATAKQVAVGAFHTCALLSNGSVRCWGANDSGVIGNGQVSGSQMTPSTVPLGGLKAKSIAVGTTASCAILEDDTLRCWGSNIVGQMGNGSTSEYQLTPVSPNLGNLSVLSVSVGYGTVCAIVEDNSLRCWGFNEMGSVGNGNRNPATTPVVVNLGGQKARQVSVGMYHTCAVLENNEVRCWGFNAYAALGNGTTTDALTPTQTSLGAQPVKQITTTTSSSCVSMLNGATRCWGMGYLGNPAYEAALTPIPVVNPPKPIPSIVSAGNQHTCAIDNKEKILCWGGNSAAELGDGTRTGPRTKPITVNTGGRKALEVSAGDQHTCAVLKDGTVLCWGFNSNGQIGQGTTSTSHYTSPVPVNVGGKAVQVSADGATTCAVLTDGTLKCWGWNSNGQVGNGTATTNLPSPVQINLGGARAVEVSVGAWHTCVVLQTSTSNGNVKCWGHNGNGKLGINSTTDQRSPVDVRLGGRRATQISASQYHTCAVMEDGDAMCWGYGGDGRLGTGSTTQRNTPYAVSLGGRKVSSISAGESHTCAVFKDKSTHCWGKGTDNQLGYGNTTSYQIPMPVGHPGTSNTSYVSAGWTHSCAAISSRVRCWGGNTTYQLGSGTSTAQIFPMPALIERTFYEEATVY